MYSVKTYLIAGNPLEIYSHNAVGNDKRDGLKSIYIGQSAAKTLRFSIDFLKHNNTKFMCLEVI